MKKIITDYLNETAVKYPNKVAFATDKEEINYDECKNLIKGLINQDNILLDSKYEVGVLN